MLKKLLAIVTLLVFVLIFYVARLTNEQPVEYKITQELTIQAPAEVIFDHLNTPKKMIKWNPWFTNDAKMQILFSGSESGIGATTHWETTEDFGTGSATVIISEINSKVSYQFNYQLPRQTTEFIHITLTDTTELNASGQQQTLVRWEIQGLNTFSQKFRSVFINTEEPIANKLLLGLQKLKSLSETPAPQL